MNFQIYKNTESVVENKDRRIKEIESHIEDLKTISDNYEKKITSNEQMVLSMKQLENLGFYASEIKNLAVVFLDISKKFGLSKDEFKIKFSRYIDRLYTLLTLEQDISRKDR